MGPTTVEAEDMTAQFFVLWYDSERLQLHLPKIYIETINKSKAEMINCVVRAYVVIKSSFQKVGMDYC